MKNHFQIKSVDEDPQRMAIRAIYQVAGSLNKCEDIFFDKEEISSKHHFVLVAVKHSLRPVTPSDLAKWMDLNNNTVTFILNRMEEQGLIAKVRDLRDQRTLRLVLTKKGEENLKEGNKAYKESTAAIMALLNPEEIQELIGLLNKVMEQTLNIRKSKKHT